MGKFMGDKKYVTWKSEEELKEMIEELHGQGARKLGKNSSCSEA